MLLTGGRVLFTLRSERMINSVERKEHVRLLMIARFDRVWSATLVGIVVTTGDETRSFEVRPGRLREAAVASETARFAARWKRYRAHLSGLSGSGGGYVQTRSSAEMCAFCAPLEAMQIRSDIASTAPKAQQLPQLEARTSMCIRGDRLRWKQTFLDRALPSTSGSWAIDRERRSSPADRWARRVRELPVACAARSSRDERPSIARWTPWTRT